MSEQSEARSAEPGDGGVGRPGELAGPPLGAGPADPLRRRSSSSTCAQTASGIGSHSTGSLEVLGFALLAVFIAAYLVAMPMLWASEPDHRIWAVLGVHGRPLCRGRRRSRRWMPT